MNTKIIEKKMFFTDYSCNPYLLLSYIFFLFTTSTIPWLLKVDFGAIFFNFVRSFAKLLLCIGEFQLFFLLHMI